jgi:multidrug efflux pump subunit AcrA (membrane-fusion protein)
MLCRDGVRTCARSTVVLWLAKPVTVIFALAGPAAMAVAQALPTSASVETLPLELKQPDRYRVFGILEPVRRVRLMAVDDGLVQSVAAKIGQNVSKTQELVQLDRTEAAARLAIAQAERKEKLALLGDNAALAEVHTAQVEAAKARIDLAQLALDRCTIRAPFAGRVLDQPVSPGQYVLKGTILVELADLSSLRALVPVDRRSLLAKSGASIPLWVEDQEVTGTVQAILPLPESHAALRELAAPFAAAWVAVPNPSLDLEPGLRVRSESSPEAPITVIPRRSLHEALAGSTPAAEDKTPTGSVQVLRSEYVRQIPVRILGEVGPERVQVSGPFQMRDVLIASSSVPLLAGTLIRFGDSGNQGEVEGTTPNPNRRGEPAGLVAPGARTPAAAGAVGSSSSGGVRRSPARPSGRPANPPQAPRPASDAPF